MKNRMELRNIQKTIHSLAMLARGEVMADNMTKEEILDFIRIKGNEEFERVFNKSDDEICVEMLGEILKSERFEDFMEELRSETK